MSQTYGLAIHGGAGAILRHAMSADLQERFRTALGQAREAGYGALERGESALDAVVAAVSFLEDCPLFNAGRGAVMNADGRCELDASIMDGRTLAAGAVTGVQHIKHPIALARAVMEKSGHVMLAGEGAERFAQTLGFELVSNEYFHTDFRRTQLEKAKRLGAAGGAGPAVPGRVTFVSIDDNDLIEQIKHGTVGCVALDRQGHLAAGTSTGGMTNKQFGRVGDSPIIGAGTYASDATCAVSATGRGEFFIRATVAHDIAAQMDYKGASLAEAAAATIAKVGLLGGDGGVIGIDRQGNVAMPFNSAGMYRGFRLSTGAAAIELFGASG